MQVEKVKMAKIIKQNGLLIYNADDEYLVKAKLKNSISYSIKNRDADCWSDNIQLSEESMNFDVTVEKDKIEIKSRLIGEHLIYADLAAFCVGKHFDISSEKIALSLEKRLSVKGRMNLLEGRNGVLIIDDTYNSNPSSACAALKTIGDIKYTKGRKVVILGNMNELGNYEKEGHELVGKCAKGKTDLAIFVGHNADNMAKAFGKSDKVVTFKNRQSLEKKLNQIIEPNDLVLVKASQNANYFEEIVKLLLPDSAECHEVLVRQEKYWKKKKK
jgi:UDP-N-acetylmuramyl pentapeptide synthase